MMQTNSLHFVSSLDEIDVPVSIYIFTVGTPLDKSGVPRMDMIEHITNDVCASLTDDNLVILRSTVEVGTTRRVVLPNLLSTGKRFMLAYCPERTIEGHALEELTSLPQIVGGLDAKSSWHASLFFQKITPTTIRVSSLEAAEIIKLLDNSFRDLFFAIGNEVALICESLGLDSREIISTANKNYSRTNIPIPGFVGGPCLYKDPHILQKSLRKLDYVPKLIKYGRELNESIPHHVLERIKANIELGDGTGHKITVLGMAFKGKPDTNDMRESPTLTVFELLRASYPGANLCGQDFIVSSDMIADIGIQAVSVEEGFRDASVVIIATNNERYESLDVHNLAGLMRSPKVIYDVWSILPYASWYQLKDTMMLSLGNGKDKNLVHELNS